MAWSEQARQAALEARRMHRRRALYVPPKPGYGVHLSRDDMAAALRAARRDAGVRRVASRSPVLANNAAVRMVTETGGQRQYFTNVKGAHFVDQGMTGKVWRYSGRGIKTHGVPAWSASSSQVARVRTRGR